MTSSSTTRACSGPTFECSRRTTRRFRRNFECSGSTRRCSRWTFESSRRTSRCSSHQRRHHSRTSPICGPASLFACATRQSSRRKTSLFDGDRKGVLTTIATSKGARPSAQWRSGNGSARRGLGRLLRIPASRTGRGPSRGVSDRDGPAASPRGSRPSARRRARSGGYGRAGVPRA